MADAHHHSEPGPEIALTQGSAKWDGARGLWYIGWLVENRSRESLEVLATRVPHGQFKSEDRRFEPALILAPGESEEFHVSVRCNEPVGLVTENAFVIFNVNWSDVPWRIFVRIRVTMNADGRPETETQSITTQRVGFSGIDS
jgi:hypothetical protein